MFNRKSVNQKSPNIVIHEESGIRLRRDLDADPLWRLFDALAWLGRGVATLLRRWWWLALLWLVMAWLLAGPGLALAQEPATDPLDEDDVEDAVGDALWDYFGGAFEFPELPTPEDITDAVWAYFLDKVTFGMYDWMVSTNNALKPGLETLFSFSDPASPFSRLVDIGWQFTLSICGGFISLAVMVAFTQRWLVAVMPGLVKMVPLGVIMGRSLIVAVLIGAGATIRQWMGQVLEMAFYLPWQILMSGDPFGWTSLFMAPFQGAILPGGGFSVLLAMALAALGYVLTLMAMLLLLFLAMLAIAALPLAATAWLYTMTEGLWGQYWWFLIKLAIAPSILAMFTRLMMEVLSLMSASLLMAALLSLILNFVMLWALFKLLTLAMPVIALGAGGAAVATGNVPAGLGLMGAGLQGMGMRGAAGDGRAAGRAIKMARQINDTDGGI